MKMKKLVIIGIGIMVGIFSIQSIMAQVVEIRPAVKKTIVYQSAVKSGQVWVTGYWKWNARKRTYVWIQGSYLKARPGRDLD